MAHPYVVPDGADNVLRYAGDLLEGGEKDKRQAIDMAVRASILAFQERQADAKMLAPLNRLLTALIDRHHGVTDPILRAANPPPSRPFDNSAKWMERAIIAAAYDVRNAIDRDQAAAWRTINADLRLSAKNIQRDQVRKWLQSLKNGTAGNRDGTHYAYWSELCTLRAQASKTGELEEFYRCTVTAALDHLNR